MTRWADPNTPTEELWARWITETANERDPLTSDLYLTTYGATHIAPFFRTLGDIVTSRAADYIRQRLGFVIKDTVKKELAALRVFLAWCEEQGYVDVAPLVPKPPRRATGTRFKTRRRGKATDLSIEQAEALVQHLPEWSESPRVPRFAVRARFIAMLETALRPATLDALCVPENYTRGAATLKITDEIDKGRFGRELPLTAAARAALDSVVPEGGLIFGTHDYRDQLKKAAQAVLAEAPASTFTAYDLRHTRLTQLAETGNLPGVAYIAGHRRLSTTDRYARGNRRAAERVLAAVDPNFTTATANPASEQNRLAGVANQANDKDLCEGGDLNPP